MAFHQVSGPAFPIPQQFMETFQAVRFLMAAQKFDRRWWRARARIQHRNVYFASRESLIENRKISNDQREQADSHAGLDHRQRSRGTAHGCDIAQPEREKRAAAVIKI